MEVSFLYTGTISEYFTAAMRSSPLPLDRRLPRTFQDSTATSALRWPASPCWVELHRQSDHRRRVADGPERDNVRHCRYRRSPDVFAMNPGALYGPRTSGPRTRGRPLTARLRRGSRCARNTGSRSVCGAHSIRRGAAGVPTGQPPVFRRGGCCAPPPVTPYIWTPNRTA